MLILINSLILLGAIGISLGALFWKHFAKRPGENVRAFIATFIGTVGIIIFLLQVAIMTTEAGQNLITILIEWLSGL